MILPSNLWTAKLEVLQITYCFTKPLIFFSYKLDLSNINLASSVIHNVNQFKEHIICL